MKENNGIIIGSTGLSLKLYEANIITVPDTDLPNLLAIVPPLKPPTIPPIANMLTATEYNVLTESSEMSSPYLSLYTSFIKFSMFCKQFGHSYTSVLHHSRDMYIQSRGFYVERRTTSGALITPVLYPNCNIPNTAANIA